MSTRATVARRRGEVADDRGAVARRHGERKWFDVFHSARSVTSAVEPSVIVARAARCRDSNDSAQAAESSQRGSDEVGLLCRNSNFDQLPAGGGAPNEADGSDRNGKRLRYRGEGSVRRSTRLGGLGNAHDERAVVVAADSRLRCAWSDVDRDAHQRSLPA
jgi:hypothetical protein